MHDGTASAAFDANCRVCVRQEFPPPRAPRHVREPLDLYGSLCSAVAMTEPIDLDHMGAMLKPSLALLWFCDATRLNFPRAQHIGIDPLEGRTQKRRPHSSGRRG